MKIVEEEYLKHTITKLNIFAQEHSDFLDFFNCVDDFSKRSLQEKSFRGDLKFFDDLSFILSVIISIISKPRISSKGEEIILRSDLAPSLSNDMFQKTLRDSTIWKQNGLDMIPEYVHYYQHVDELKIYENIFIVYLIRKIDLEIIKYNEFYYSMIQTFENSNNNLTKFEDFISKAFKKLNLLNHKIKLIKGTQFYKCMLKESAMMKVVHPTNILTKNRLYNFCYKFYKKITSYIDETEKINDFRNYYTVNIIKAIKQLGFEIAGENNIVKDEKFGFDKLEFETGDFHLKLYPEEENHGLVLEIKNSKVKSHFQGVSKNLLLFDTNIKFDDIEANNKDLYDSVELISLWNLAAAYGDVSAIFNNFVTEIEIVKYWITSKLQCVSCSLDLYTKYCPSCKSTDIVQKKGSYYCESCHSKYVFYSFRRRNQNLWFIRYRNKKTSV